MSTLVELTRTLKSGKEVNLEIALTSPEPDVGMMGWGYEFYKVADKDFEQIEPTEEEEKEIEELIVKFLDDYKPYNDEPDWP